MTTHVTQAIDADGARSRGPSPIALLLILSIQLMVVLDMTVVNVALPTLQDDLGFSASGLSWVLNAYALAFGGLLLLGARLGDILGRRRVLIGGVAVFGIASLLGGLAPTSELLLLARGLQGLGAAVAAPQALALLTISYPEGSARNRALGWYSAVSIGGSAIGLVVGGMLTEWLSWRWAFFINVPVGLAIIALAPRYLPSSPRHSGRFDLAGAAASTVGVTSLVYGLVHAAEHGWQNSETIEALAFGVALLAVFVAIERSSSQPITPLRLFAHRDRAVAYVSRLLLVAAMMGMFFFLTQFLQRVHGYGPVETGLAFLPLTAALLFFSQLSARVLVERLGSRLLMMTGMSISTVALIPLVMIDANTGYVPVLLSVVLFGIGNGLAFVPLTALGLTDVPHEDAGAASGLLNVMQQVGGALGLAVLVSVFGSATRDAQPTAATAIGRQHEVLTTGMSSAFLAALVLIAVAVATVSVGASRRVRTEQPA
ncbi:MFS transporter [Solicola gregarius]|uniref:MFS transporter n=1 Tax=Solicola gregarius TaxID=2908642 RepID=A0AA46YKB9_9ACTN|nr:MFS transporter [Solicola gregarius]UYM05595.1 MFS transporter [Solicola gregarius]